jgi:hypothetical protein
VDNLYCPRVDRLTSDGNTQSLLMLVHIKYNEVYTAIQHTLAGP